MASFGDNSKINEAVRNAVNAVGLNKDGQAKLHERIAELKPNYERGNLEYSTILELAKELYDKYPKYRK